MSPPLGQCGFIKLMPPEGLAAPPPWWWCLLCVFVVCCSLVWLLSLVACQKVPKHNPKIRLGALLVVPPRLAPHLWFSRDVQDDWAPLCEWPCSLAIFHVAVWAPQYLWSSQRPSTSRCLVASGHSADCGVKSTSNVFGACLTSAKMPTRRPWRIRCVSCKVFWWAQWQCS